MHHVGEGPGDVLITGNGLGRVIEPKGGQFSGSNLGMTPNEVRLLLYKYLLTIE